MKIVPTISILITYYNEREMLSSCLETLATQTVLPDEILIYDDASTHPPEPFIPESLNVRVIHGTKNVGPGAGRNILLQEASSDYVHFHDSDDWFHPEWCATIKSRLAKEAIDVLFTEITSSSEAVPSYKHPFMGFVGCDQTTDMVAFAIEKVLLVPSATMMRNSVLSIGGFRASLWQSEDKDFYIRLMSTSVSWAIETRPLICIRNRPDSRSKNQSEVWLSGLKCLEFARTELPARYHRCLANAAARCATQLLRLNQRTQAVNALRLAAELGGADYRWRSRGFRILRKIAGEEIAERVSLLLQKAKSAL